MTERSFATSALAVVARRTAVRARLPEVYARLALGTAFLSAVAARFGLWSGKSSWTSFARFQRDTAEVVAFMPAATIPFLAWSATVAEFSLGLALVVGFRVRWAAFGSAGLLTLFGTAMAVSLGIKEPLDYSVFSAASAALLLALHESRPDRGTGARVQREFSDARPGS